MLRWTDLNRLALTTFMPLTHDIPVPLSSDAQAFGAYIAEHMEFMDPQRHDEEAILTANQPPDERAVRHRRVM